MIIKSTESTGHTGYTEYEIQSLTPSCAELWISLSCIKCSLQQAPEEAFEAVNHEN
jgi:hypothetical protein